jgi:ribosomal protein S18 acetylase RimI-like enzyme
MAMNHSPEPNSRLAMVRRYQAADREAVHRIGGDTAFFGLPIETYMEDRQPFLDMFMAYYTDHDAQYAWVAVGGGQVVGYLTGCPDSDRHDRVVREQIRPQVLRWFLRGRYRIGPRSRRYIFRLALASMRREYTEPDHAVYPAHLHINVAEGWRGRGLGRQLLTAYLDQLRAAGVVGVHLGTTTFNRAAVHLYRSLGFEVLSACRSRMWEGLIDEPVENLSLGLRLETGTGGQGIE